MPGAKDTLVQFLEAACHYILYVREVYPAGRDLTWSLQSADLFEPRRLFNVPVRMSRHPLLNGYIADVLGAVRPDLEKGVVNKILLSILDERHTPVEKFTFQIRSLVEGLTEEQKREAKTSASTTDIESFFRSFLTKISVCDSMLSPNPPGSVRSLPSHRVMNVPGLESA
ncbi:DNA-binding protein [Blyttiomyces helicus]|uniref:DNA-binding protein n=1 Tax=Blyttiomyces helicus TaxID=388810 RepID=A0A4P9WDC3_9FUNG|nr:DNA-binding protein [Blyttiomyces helicus]|eukprot:RKO90681.1 DNA-binding protein [Blyttiomyces helicus]